MEITGSSQSKSFRQALKEWLEILPQSRVFLRSQDTILSCTTGSERTSPLTLQLETSDEIKAVLKIAQKHRVPVYPISTGRNWGYSCASPAINGSVILDLSKMNRILEFNEEMGWVRIEPGVTQQQLRDYLDEKELRFMVPVTDGGPECSLLGNLLERGHGITPHVDHFESLLSLRAVLPDGTSYSNPFSDLGCEDVANNFKWDLGPNVAGLFGQSNLGIVTEGTLSLARLPETHQAFTFTLSRPEDLPLAVEAIRKIKQELPGIVAGIKLMNDRQILAMNIIYPENFVVPGKIMSQVLVDQLCKAHKLDSWTGIGGLYGDKAIVKAARQKIRRVFKPFAKKIQFFSAKNATTARVLAKVMPSFLGGRHFQKKSKQLRNLMDMIAGQPTDGFLHQAYWRSHVRFENSTKNPTLDKTGLIFYSPVMTINADRVQQFEKLIVEQTEAFGIEPVITLTAISERCFQGTVSILFDAKNADFKKRAQSCFEALFQQGLQQGYCPARLGLDDMRKVTELTSSPHWQLIRKFKGVLDPQHILAPGRYCAKPRHPGFVLGPASDLEPSQESPIPE